MYDLIIIGGGPAGYNAAERAAHSGLKTLLIEKNKLGGVCLNEGCIPTKTLLYSAKIFDYAKHSEEYGVKFTGASVDHPFIIERKNKVVKTLVGGITASLKAAGVEVVNGEAVIIGKNADGFTVRASGVEYIAKNLLICAGSEAAVPPIPGLKEGIASGFALTNREILDLKELPESLAVIGGGVIGLEMASYFNSIGVRVSVIEMLPKIGGQIDSDIASILHKNYLKKGIEFKLGAKVLSVGQGSVEYELKGEKITEKCGKVLIAIGRRAVTSGLGLESVGVLTERGAIVTDEHARTSVANIYAAGDVNGKSMLAHTAYREGEVAVNTILGKRDRVNYNTIPAVIYTNPEVAVIGETVESASAKGIPADGVTLPLKYSGRYIAENERGDGIVKIVYAKSDRRIIGIHMIGSYASEIIYGAAVMMESAMTVDDARKVVFPHPTVGEVIREGMFFK
ncbi:dihydrolipoyl dehydrogenase [Clostridia bacterium]|nr:dihydrolipoyl dehydrogenase [Clostridia bacterium]